VWAYHGDPRQGGQGRIGRLLTTPVGDLGTFTAVEGDAAGGWQTREHHLAEPALIGWVAYPLGRVTAPSLPKDLVVAGFGRLALEDYVARVVTGELGASREPAALQAQALAARSYVVWFVTNKGYGTDEKPVPNGESFQVCARVAFPHCQKAAASTSGGLVLHRGRVVLTSYVAGALWPSGKVPSPAAARSAPDPTGTEKWVTYNDGHVGRSVVPSPIASLSSPDNRGCMSQNGAVALAKLGHSWAQILRFFYGADATFSIAEPASVARPDTPRAGPTLVTPRPAAPVAPRPAAPVAPSDDGGLLALSAALTIYRMVSS
jgi:hypothetical protein